MVKAVSPKVLAVIAVLAVGAACGKKPPVPIPPSPSSPQSFPQATDTTTPQPSGPPTAPPAPPLIDDQPVTTRSADWNGKKLDEINGQDGPLRPVFFAFDSDELDETARKVLAADAEVLKTYASWALTIEGHCAERGTAEYNLALGDRRALAAKNYLQSLGVRAERLKTVSYGKEFPFDAGHDEGAWFKNRRAQLMVTSK